MAQTLKWGLCFTSKLYLIALPSKDHMPFEHLDASVKGIKENIIVFQGNKKTAQKSHHQSYTRERSGHMSQLVQPIRLKYNLHLKIKCLVFISLISSCRITFLLQVARFGDEVRWWMSSKFYPVFTEDS